MADAEFKPKKHKNVENDKWFKCLRAIHNAAKKKAENQSSASLTAEKKKKNHQKTRRQAKKGLALIADHAFQAKYPWLHSMSF